MSAPVAGKFQDHYIVLGVEPDADTDAIQAAYARLGDKYAGDTERLAILQQAYEVLSDPDLRASFDAVKGVDIEKGAPKFTGAEFFDALEKSAGLRSAVLSILYDRRRVKSFKPSLSNRHLDGMLLVTGEALNFALWYLKKRGFVIYDDKSAMEITVDGMDFLEQNRPSPEVVLQFIKPEAVVSPATSSVTRSVTSPSPSREPVLNVLSRALQRNTTPEEVPPRVTVRFE